MMGSRHGLTRPSIPVLPVLWSLQQTSESISGGEIDWLKHSNIIIVARI
jgi:hypothetical protein